MTAYFKTAVIITLLIFIPPLGWFVTYKYSTFDRRTNIILAAACFAFFVYANISAGNVDIFGSGGFEVRTTPEEFREKFNNAAQRLAPNLGLNIDTPLEVSGNGFVYDFTPKLRLEGTLDGEKISALKIITTPDTKDESFQSLNVLGLLIATLNPELDAEDRGEVFRDLRMLKNVATEESYDWTTKRGKVTYSVHVVPDEIIFTADLAE